MAELRDAPNIISIKSRLVALEALGVGGGASDLADLTDVSDAIAPTAGHYMRGTGSAFTNSAILEADVPTLAQSKITNLETDLSESGLQVKIGYAEKYIKTTGVGFTSDLDDALTALTSGIGGEIILPKAEVDFAGGELDVPPGVTIDGYGTNENGGGRGTHLNLVRASGAVVDPTCAFRITGASRKVTLKNFTLEMTDVPASDGVLMTNPSGFSIHSTHLENITFLNGRVQINALHTGGGEVSEMISNTVQRCSMITATQAAFKCNTINSGFKFSDGIYVHVDDDCVGFDITEIGNLIVEDYLAVGFNELTSNSTLLKTTGAFNNIVIKEGHIEGIEWDYRKETNSFPEVAVVFKDNLLQGKMHFAANGAIVLDNNRVTTDDDGYLTDSVGGYALVHLRGVNHVSNPGGTKKILTEFTNQYSQVYHPNGRINDILIQPAGTTTTPTQHCTVGAANIPTSRNYAEINNNMVIPSSIITAVLRTYDTTGIHVTGVFAGTGVFYIYLNENPPAEMQVAWELKY